MSTKNELFPVDSWPAFVDWAACQYSLGKTAKELGQQIEGTRVTWQGQVYDNSASVELAPSVTLDMQPVEVLLKDGRKFVGDYLSLPTRDSRTKEQCVGLKRGDKVTFTAIIGSASAVFPSINFAEDEEQKKVFLETPLQSVTIVSTSRV